MALRWFEEDGLVERLPRRRRAFFDNKKALIEAANSLAIGEMMVSFDGSLSRVAMGQRDGVKVDDLGPDWTSTPFQIIYDTLDDWNESRWFAGLLLMQTAIDHPGSFCAYKPDEEGAGTAYFRDNRAYTTTIKDTAEH